MEGRVTTWREGCNDSKEGTPHGGKGAMIQRKGHRMEGRVTTWREGCNDSKEGSPHGGKGHHMEGRV